MRSEVIYRALLSCYPAEFRREYGGEMVRAFARQLDDAPGFAARARVWAAAAADLVAVAPAEHFHILHQDLGYALRMLGASPVFTTVAIVSIALGIGAGTAIFSLLNSVLYRVLPVREPGQLVLLSDPSASGVAVGSMSGERALLSYQESVEMRSLTDVFSGVMAVQSALDKWQARIDGGAPEEIRGRLVTGAYFEVLGVKPLMGRFFESGTDDSPGAAPYAVISHDFWMRRFGGQFDVLGKPVIVRKAPLTIIGVAPAGFRGETTGQRPDLWVPLSMQAGVIPGRDLLHDQALEKVMWLHTFARLRPGVTMAQAETRANLAFRHGLESFYGRLLAAGATNEYREFLDQRLKLSAAAIGASKARGRVSNALWVLLGVVGAVLLIACVNVANLLLARAAAREKEIALRLFLGASRGRLFRQMLTESLVLALAGGLLGLAAAYGFHRALVALVVRTEESFHLDFALDARVAAFTAGVTILAALVAGLLPALRASRAGSPVRAGRGQTASAPQLAWGRTLVATQIALSLPLLMGAGLFLRTLYNLRQVDLGYAREKLLLVRVDARMAGYDGVQRPLVYTRLLEEFRRVPGVRAATFSENGLFSGRDSADEVEVEGYTRTGRDDQAARWDHLGPEYFTTLGIPIRMGRDINSDDRATSPRVCIINEAFQKLFFAGRDPIGMRITSIYADQRLTCRVVGVTADSRGRQLRGNVPPRFYSPLTQPLGDYDSVEFEIRATGSATALDSAVRDAMRRVDANLPVVRSTTLDAALDGTMAVDRILSDLSVIFGLAALVLTAVGLFGVLSYGVARRRAELGIRVALGARPAGVTAMILRETVWLAGAGLAIGAVLTFAATRLMSSQIYGVTPQDPATAAGAAALLMLVSLVAACLPAWRAARLDPMAALRQE